jgi:hypothetical protein
MYSYLLSSGFFISLKFLYQFCMVRIRRSPRVRARRRADMQVAASFASKRVSKAIPSAAMLARLF